MEKKMNNKGFSLVELIIVVAIMAVLIGVLAPAYLQYVEKSKRTSDCSAIGSIMDAMEILAADPAVTWSKDQTATAAISATADVTYGGTATNIGTKLNEIVPKEDARITGSWSDITVTGTKTSTGTVNFTISGTITKPEIQKISPALANRIE